MKAKVLGLVFALLATLYCPGRPPAIMGPACPDAGRIAVPGPPVAITRPQVSGRPG